MGILISGGDLVTPRGSVPAELLIEGERIAAVAVPGTIDRSTGIERVIDATGRLVVPGGVDVHTHLDMPAGDGLVSSDDFDTGTRAAAWGGTTTIVDFAEQNPGDRVEDKLVEWHAKAAGRAHVDYGFHMIIGDVNPQSLGAMTDLVADGVTSFKLFTAYPGSLYLDDGDVLRVMQEAARLGAVVMMHAENGIAIDVLAEQAVARGHTGPVNHGLVRRPEFEAEATARTLELAAVAGSALYIVHVSCGEALDVIREARTRGAPVAAETCPHYLFLSLEEHLARPGLEGALYVCSTPLRSRQAGNQEALWTGMATDDLTVVATDHCPFCRSEKARGLADFRLIPNGVGGIEHRMVLIYQGVVEGRISLARWVELTSTAPSRIFGLHPAKGSLDIGADADIVLFDPAATTRISSAGHHSAADHSAYEGFELRGAIDTVISRGRVLVEKGLWTESDPGGRYLRRGRSVLI